MRARAKQSVPMGAPVESELLLETVNAEAATAAAATAGGGGRPARPAECKFDTQHKVTLLSLDMPIAMVKEAARLADESMSHPRSNEMHVASYIKNGFDLRYPGSPWHLFVGKEFGSSILRQRYTYANFKVAKTQIAMFRAAERLSNTDPIGYRHDAALGLV